MCQLSMLLCPVLSFVFLSMVVLWGRGLSWEYLFKLQHSTIICLFFFFFFFGGGGGGGVGWFVVLG